jgi:selenium metabolism protein YedF
MKEIDARGLACPAPVLQTKAALQEESTGSINVIIDNAASQENVQRFLESQGFTTDLRQEGSDFMVIGTRGVQEAPSTAPMTVADADTKKIMVMCATDCMGLGDDILGQKLMINFLRTLKEMGPDLWHLVFVNNGVKLTIDDSPILSDLKDLVQSGTKILVCGTCLDHFSLLERKQIGETTNMLDIVMAMQLADKVINI